MKPLKTWHRILAGGRNIPFSDFEKVVFAFGFELKRITGSHRIYRHPRITRPLTLQPRKGEAKPYQISQVLQIVEESGLTMEGDE